MRLAFDTETTGLSTFHGAYPFLATTYDGVEAKYWLPKQYPGLKLILEDSKIEKIAFNTKFDMLHLETQNIYVSPIIHDAMIMSFLYNENTRHSLEVVSELYLKKKKTGDTVKDWLNKNGYTKERQKVEKRAFYELVPLDIMIPYALNDVVLTYELFLYFEDKLKSMNLWDLYCQEMALIPVLIKMQKQGVAIDIPYFTELQREYVHKKTQLSEQLLNVIKIPDFNLNATQQLSKWLKTTKNIILPETQKGADSVDKYALAPYASDPDIQLLLDYRFCTKMLSTYIDPYLENHVNGNLHADFNQIGARSGRFSCQNPNLQNINKPDEDDPESFILRRGFVTEKDHFLVYADFFNMEVFVFVDYATDQKMIKTLCSGEDFHQKNADAIGTTRKKAKTFVFALLFGAGIKKIDKMLGVSDQEAARYKNNFFNNFSDVEKFIKDASAVCATRGFVMNRYKRRQRLGKEKSYIAVNRLIQGTCADLVKEKMIRVDKILNNTKSHLIMQIHDELVISLHKDEMHLIPLIKKEMENAGHVLKHLPLKVEIEYSKTNWAEKEKWHDPTNK